MNYLFLLINSIINYIIGDYMKNLKEFLPLWKLIKREKYKLIIASLLLFMFEISSIFQGFLIGLSVE